MQGHTKEVSKCSFNGQSTKILTASNDATARIWDANTGKCLQTLSGHDDEIFSATFNYESDTIITGSKDNTCVVWKDSKKVGGTMME